MPTVRMCGGVRTQTEEEVVSEGSGVGEDTQRRRARWKRAV